MVALVGICVHSHGFAFARLITLANAEDIGRRWTRHGRVRVAAELIDERFLGRFDAQTRHWLVQRVLSEALTDLEELDQRSTEYNGPVDRPRITADWTTEPAHESDGTLYIDGQQVMQQWELPLMRRMVMRTARSQCDYLEIGFGMGLSASLVQEAGVRSHTIIELNDAVVERADRWRAALPNPDRIRLVQGSWQDQLETLGNFDGVLFDPYPATEQEYLLAALERYYPNEFFKAIRRHLNPGARVTYYTNEIDTLSRPHQRALLESFDAFEVEVVRDLNPPNDCAYWWASSMAVVTARA